MTILCVKVTETLELITEIEPALTTRIQLVRTIARIQVSSMKTNKVVILILLVDLF